MEAETINPEDVLAFSDDSGDEALEAELNLLATFQRPSAAFVARREREAKSASARLRAATTMVVQGVRHILEGPVLSQMSEDEFGEFRRRYGDSDGGGSGTTNGGRARGRGTGGGGGKRSGSSLRASSRVRLAFTEGKAVAVADVAVLAGGP